MRITELPAAARLVEDPHKFAGVINELCDDSRGAEKAMVMIEVARKMYLTRGRDSEEQSDRAYYALRKARDSLSWKLDRNEVAYYMPLMRLIELVGIESDGLSTVRRMIEQLWANATDDEECVERLTQNLDMFRCSHCQEWEFCDETRTTRDDNPICRVCARDDFLYSSYYGSYIHNQSGRWALDANGAEVFIDEDDDDFGYDEDADRYVHIEFRPPEPEVIGTYHSSKAHQSVRSDDWVKATGYALGVELEVEIKDFAIQPAAKARELNEEINHGKVGHLVFFERDGSLSNGFEIISQPMSLPEHSKLWQWLNKPACVRHLLSHKTSSCGLHVHVSKRGLSALQIGKMVAFVNLESNKDFITALARRYATGYSRVKEEKSKVGCASKSSGDRYEAVNITNSKTVEFRIFKGTLKYQSVMAALEFVHALCQYTKTGSDCTANDLSYQSFLKFCETKMPKATKTLRDYVNPKLEIEA